MLVYGVIVVNCIVFAFDTLIHFVSGFVLFSNFSHVKMYYIVKGHLTCRAHMVIFSPYFFSFLKVQFSYVLIIE